MNSSKQGGAEAGAWHCNRRNLRPWFSEHKLRRCSCSALPCLWLGLCLSRPIQMKAVKLHLALLTFSSHRLFIICCPHVTKLFIYLNRLC
jgi:hypothetical protein